MTAQQRKHLEERLLQERDRTLRSLAQFDETARVSGEEDDGELSNYPVHPADEGTDTIEQEQNFLLASKEGRQLYAIDRALRKLYKERERFGRCVECGEEIAFERLDLVPWTEHCIACQQDQEQRPTEPQAA